MDDVRPQAMAPPPPGPMAGGRGAPGSGWRWLLFSFIGRADRAHFWTGIALSFSLAVGALLPLLVVGEEGDSVGSESNGTLVLVFFALFLLALWVYVAVGVKRWHDRDKSGAWMLLQLVPFGPLWIIVECGFLPGTDGPNRYGEDPRSVAATPDSASF